MKTHMILTTLFLGIFISLNSQASFRCTADCELSGSELLFSEANMDSYTEARCKERGGRGDYAHGYYNCFRYTKQVRSVSGSGSYQSDAQREAEQTCRSYAYTRSGYDYVQFSGIRNWDCRE